MKKLIPRAQCEENRLAGTACRDPVSGVVSCLSEARMHPGGLNASMWFVQQRHFAYTEFLDEVE